MTYDSANYEVEKSKRYDQMILEYNLPIIDNDMYFKQLENIYEIYRDVYLQIWGQICAILDKCSCQNKCTCNETEIMKELNWKIVIMTDKIFEIIKNTPK